MTDTKTSHNIDLPSWDSLHNVNGVLSMGLSQPEGESDHLQDFNNYNCNNIYI
jgi:hypothetical protein